ncbi:MAG TPA: hypothetical protein VGS99_05360 [Gammaproteobacteria bacterium]|nr:hypothetical protein [Gammaproteobacteria bacterium]
MSDQIVVSEGMLDALRATRPWVKFLSILGFVLCVLMALVGLAFVGGAGAKAGPMAAFGPAIGVFYLLFVLLYFFPCLHLLRYANAIARIPADGQRALEEALVKQKSFWKFIGILTAVVLVLELAILIISILMGVALGLRGH